MAIHECSLIAATLTHLARKDADTAQIADAIVSTCQKIDAALSRSLSLSLSPVIGRGGVAAIYWRSLYQTGKAQPWLAGAYEGVQLAMDLAALKSVLAKQSSADAAAGGGAILQTFYELLVSLIGPSFTERLFQQAAPHP
jgi:hypothetical protein